MLGADADPAVPMGTVIANELELIGSHGMQAFAYGRMLQMISAGVLRPNLLISDRVTLSQAAELLPRMNEFPGDGVTVIDRMY
jgi:alcohol dehydrogenase